MKLLVRDDIDSNYWFEKIYVNKKFYGKVIGEGKVYTKLDNIPVEPMSRYVSYLMYLGTDSSSTTHTTKDNKSFPLFTIGSKILNSNLDKMLKVLNR